MKITASAEFLVIYLCLNFILYQPALNFYLRLIFGAFEPFLSTFSQSCRLTSAICTIINAFPRRQVPIHVLSKKDPSLLFLAEAPAMLLVLASMLV